MNDRLLPTAFAIITLAAGLACNEYPVHNLGNTTQPSGPAAPELDLAPPVARHMSELVGSWLGEAEDPFALASSAELNPPPFRLPSGSTHIWLQVLELGSASEATITFGDVEPPAPATDPDLPYPPGASPSVYSADIAQRPPVEGYRYGMYRVLSVRDAEATGVSPFDRRITEGELIDGKLELSYLTNEAFGSWCALQTAESCADEGYAIEDDGSCYAGDDTEPTNCGKVTMCASQVCTCEPGNSCSYSIRYPATLVLRRSEDGLVGLFQNGVFANERGFQQPLGTVHFRRVVPSDTP